MELKLTYQRILTSFKMNDRSFATRDPCIFLLLTGKQVASFTLYELFEKTQVSVTPCPKALGTCEPFMHNLAKSPFVKRYNPALCPDAQS
jgi:hypothetical protein